MGFFKPNVEQLEKSRNVKKLMAALEYKADLTVRKNAARALGNLKVKVAIPALEAALLREENRNAFHAIVGALGSIGYNPRKNQVGAQYAALTNDYDFCVSCGTAFAVPNLFSAFMELGDGDSHFYKHWREAYLRLGSDGFQYIVQFFEQMYSQYKQFISNITEINFAFDEDKQKSAVIKLYSYKFFQLVETVAQYKDAAALVYLTEIYRRVRKEVYSHSAGGFSDIFCAADIRGSIVESIRAFDRAVHGERMTEFLWGVLSFDENSTVRWKAVLVLEKWPPETVRQNPLLTEALEHTLRNVPSAPEYSGTTGYQKQKICEILGMK